MVPRRVQRLFHCTENGPTIYKILAAVAKALQRGRLHSLQACIALAACLFFQRHTEQIIIPSRVFRLHLKIVAGFVQFCTVFQLMPCQCLSVKWWALADVHSASFSHDWGI